MTPPVSTPAAEAMRADLREATTRTEATMPTGPSSAVLRDLIARDSGIERLTAEVQRAFVHANGPLNYAEHREAMREAHRLSAKLALLTQDASDAE